MVMGLRAEDGSADFLLLGAWSGASEQALWRWKEATPELHEFVPDFHRLVLEHWLWKAHKDGRMTGRVLDVGVIDRRAYLGGGYRTFGEPGSGCDVEGDLLLLYPSDLGGCVETIIATEVLEHVTDPFQAIRHLHENLTPGGRLFVTSPFIWPWHGTKVYRDYWRFTHEGWLHLLKEVAGFREVHLIEVPWTGEGAQAYDTLRRWEGMGFRDQTTAATGYLCEAVK